MSKRSVVLNTKKMLHALKEQDCKLFVRVDGFRLVGILTKIRREYDPQIGKDRQWGMGITLNGEVFEEPLDRKNPKTGRLETVIVRETPFLMITARKTSDPKDDDVNFNWLPHQFHLDAMKELEDELVAQQRVMNRLDEEYRSLQSKMDMIKRDATIAVEENNNLKATVDFQSRRLLQLEREWQELYTLLQKLRAQGLEVEGELAIEVKRALEKGREKAMSPHEIRMKKLKEDEEEKQMIERTIARKQTVVDVDEIRELIKDEIRKAVATVSKPKKSSSSMEELLSKVE